MSGPRRRALAAIVAAQLAVVLGLAGFAAADLAFGEEVRLRVQPLDPLDVFRGNYVVLRYEISSVPAPSRIERGQRVCALLSESGGAWRLAGVRTSPPDDGTVICGRAQHDTDAGSAVSVEYGIETFFASAERAQEIEDAMATRDVYAVVDLDDDGSARIERLDLGD